MHQATKVGWVMKEPFPHGNFFFSSLDHFHDLVDRTVAQKNQSVQARVSPSGTPCWAAEPWSPKRTAPPVPPVPFLTLTAEIIKITESSRLEKAFKIT